MTPLFPELADAGLVLQGAVPVDLLDDDVRTSLARAVPDVGDYRALVLLGHAGRRFWRNTVRDVAHRRDPFDELAVELVTAWFARHQPGARLVIVYPGPTALPLGRLAEDVGWGRPSPLGLTIHPHYGLWIAHRAAFLTDLELDHRESAGPHPCDSCADRPCEDACPARAVSASHGFDVEACARYRIAAGSDCALQCRARNACPVGAEHRYDPAQMRHHYAAGLESIRRWLDPGSGQGMEREPG